jgi:hypothetical protein
LLRWRDKQMRGDDNMGFFDFFRKNEKATKLDPESRVMVGFNDEKIWCTCPGAPDQAMLWTELIVVAIETTDEGPFAPDVFWVLGAKDKTVIYPGGATGDQEMLKRLQLLPGFNNEAVIAAAGCTDNNVFVCWEKGPRQPSGDGQATECSPHSKIHP